MPYDKAKAERAVRWIETYCSHVKGAKGGQPFILEDWQKDDIIRPLFGTLNDNGLRQFRTCYVEVPRKNGKSTLCAALALYMLCADGEPGAEVVSAAADRNQARLVFEVAQGMIRQSPELRTRLDLQQHAIKYGANWYKAISAEANTKHGFNCHAVIYDEIHSAVDRTLWDVLATSTGARTQPLIMAITTAGHDTSTICWELHEYARKVKQGEIDDPSFLPVLYGADIKDDWTQPETWKKANPGFGTICMASYFEQEVKRCQNNPSQVNTFLRLHLNIWTSGALSWITDSQFMRGAETIPEERLKHLPLYVGLDLSSTKDLTAVAMLWRDDDRDLYYLRCHHFVNEEKAQSRSLSGGVDYLTFQRAGLVSITPGNVTDMDAVREWIIQLSNIYEITALAFDRWMSHMVVPFLDGINCEPFGQGYASQSVPTKEMERLMCEGKMIHDGHAVLRWQFGCVQLARDEADNVKVTKKKNSESQKVDGVVSSVMALGIYLQTAQHHDPFLEIVTL